MQKLKIKGLNELSEFVIIINVLKLPPKISKSTKVFIFCSSMPAFSLEDFEVVHLNVHLIHTWCKPKFLH